MFQFALLFDTVEEATPVLTDFETLELLEGLRDTSFNHGKQALLERALMGKQVTAGQGRLIIRTFDFISGPVEAAKWFVETDKIADTHNLGRLVADLASWNQREVLSL